MELLAGRKRAIVLAEWPGLDREELPLCHRIGVLRPHAFLQHFADESGYAGLPFGRLDTDPMSNLFLQGDRDILHSTRLVGHEVRVNLRIGGAI
jgi:hypothetical protein